MVKLLLILGLLLPWTVLFFFDKNAIKRFMPVTIFTCLLMTIIFQIAYTYDWWVIKTYIVPWGYMIDVTFAYGIYAVGTFLIFYFTFHKFWLYVAVNFIMDLFVGFILFKILNPLGVATMKSITEWQYFLVVFCLSLVIYMYQLWQEKIFVNPNDSVNEYD